MLQEEKVKVAVDAIRQTCTHCEICSPDCPVFIAKRAMEGLLYDLKEAAAKEKKHQ